jgi:SnoaL-like domain
MTITAEREAHLEDLFAPRVWTPDLFADFWAEPELRFLPSIITDDIVGYWPGGRVARGAADYIKVLEDLLTLLPDLRLDVPERATSADGQFGFARWIMHATGHNGPFEMVGADRTRIRDGLVSENYIFFDSAEFEALVGLNGASA